METTKGLEPVVWHLNSHVLCDRTQHGKDPVYLVWKGLRENWRDDMRNTTR